jgi:TrmH family RNA methyltransferase
MKNMGLRHLVLVAPSSFDLTQAAAMAVHASDVLDGRCEAASLAEAVAGCGLVVGTCGRPAAALARGSAPRALAPEIVAACATNDVALVFGPEDHGLSNNDLALCQRVISIPASPVYDSLNLAQAVLVCAYEVLLAASRPLPPSPRTLATSERLELMYASLEPALRAIGFLHRDNAEHMMRTLRLIFARAALDDREVQVLLGISRQIAWAASRA